MQKMICVPVEQYQLMLETYDKVIAELEEMKRILQEGGEECSERKSLSYSENLS